VADGRARRTELADLCRAGAGSPRPLEFAAKTGELTADYSYSVRSATANSSRAVQAGDGANSDGKTVPLTQLQAGKVTILSLIRDIAKSGRMYYALNLRYVTPARDVEALNRVSLSRTSIGTEPTDYQDRPRETG